MATAVRTAPLVRGVVMAGGRCRGRRSSSPAAAASRSAEAQGDALRGGALPGSPLRHHRSRLPHPRRRRPHLVVAAGSSNGSGGGAELYAVLGVDPQADVKAIKAAYRAKAKKLHPDVNRAPDAQERFLECKMAYQVLSDPKSRAEYDRKRRYAGAGSGGPDWGDFWGAAAGGAAAGGAAGGGGRRGARQPEEEFYGFDDFFRDLDKELEGLGSGASLFSTLANDLVEFLEEGLKDLESELADVSDDWDAAARDIRDKYANYTYDPTTGAGSWGTPGGQQPGGASGATSGGSSTSKAGSGDEDVDEVLREMKKRMGL
eukprot:jgi/Tetstr1/422203/TSEL_013055.t1